MWGKCVAGVRSEQADCWAASCWWDVSGKGWTSHPCCIATTPKLSSSKTDIISWFLWLGSGLGLDTVGLGLDIGPCMALKLPGQPGLWPCQSWVWQAIYAKLTHTAIGSWKIHAHDRPDCVGLSLNCPSVLRTWQLATGDRQRQRWRHMQRQGGPGRASCCISNVSVKVRIVGT